MLSEGQIQDIYDAVLLLRYETNISNGEVIRYLDALEDAYANVLSHTQKTECSLCHKTDDETPLFPFRQNGEVKHTCVKCYHATLDLNKKDEDGLAMCLACKSPIRPGEGIELHGQGLVCDKKCGARFDEMDEGEN